VTVTRLGDGQLYINVPINPSTMPAFNAFWGLYLVDKFRLALSGHNSIFLEGAFAPKRQRLEKPRNVRSFRKLTVDVLSRPVRHRTNQKTSEWLDEAKGRSPEHYRAVYLLPFIINSGSKSDYSGNPGRGRFVGSQHIQQISLHMFRTM
jgi:hypothetical protein